MLTTDTVIEEQKAREYLERSREVTRDCTVYDIHAHPFDLFLRDFNYRPNSTQPGLFNSGRLEYHPTRIGPVRAELLRDDNISVDNRLKGKAAVLSVRRAYSHTGPKVFCDQMDLAGIDRCLLLPITNGECEAHSSLMMAKEMFGHHPRFILAYSVPNKVEDQRIAESVRLSVEEYGARAIKIYPSVTGTNIGSPAGVKRVERILQSSRDFRLVIVVHGGLSPLVKDRKAVEYGTLRNWDSIDWEITDSPVVIAHAGAFGYKKRDLEREVFPRLSKLLDRHRHLVVDVSGLGTDAIVGILNRVDTSRIVFGSDALYYSPWEAMVRIGFALDRAGLDFEDSLRLITSVNPSRILGSER